MAGTFNLQIVTPEREIFNGPVESVTVPGMQASFGVLRNHAPLISALEPGLVDIYDADAREIRIAIGGGFFQVARNQAMVLADSAEIASEINVERAREAEGRARSRPAGRMEPEAEIQRERAEAALKRARSRLRIASGQ
jgi:F-type H+-transporting ATPase subunit epsilon